MKLLRCSYRDEPHKNRLDDDAVYAHRERSPTPVYNDSNSRPRKRLFKKSSGPVDLGLEDEIGDAGRVRGRDDAARMEKGEKKEKRIPRPVDDDNFIDDTRVDPSDRYGSDNGHSPSRAPQVKVELRKTKGGITSLD
ncbi:hypothetical protein ACS0TY_025957 [Phlomoides rotata]